MTNNSSKTNKVDFSSAQAVITTENVQAHASEIHGVLTGLICAGFTFEDQMYLSMLNDMFNNGDGFPKVVKNTIEQMYSELWTDILDDAYTFQLLLPDDDETLAERGNALGMWVQGFNLGFGLQQKDKAVASEEVKEVITDFAEIANLSDDMDEDEESERAFFEIGEYVRISALLCFRELGTPPTQSSSTDDNTSGTIH